MASRYGISATARKQSFYSVSETCPFVDKALDNLADALENGDSKTNAVAFAAEAIKKQTNLLRDALIEAIENALIHEAEASEKDSIIANLESTISDLEYQLQNAN
jgi:hypothetical protein